MGLIDRWLDVRIIQVCDLDRLVILEGGVKIYQKDLRYKSMVTGKLKTDLRDEDIR